VYIEIVHKAVGTLHQRVNIVKDDRTAGVAVEFQGDVNNFRRIVVQKVHHFLKDRHWIAVNRTRSMAHDGISLTVAHI
jgi:hypothetical protein